MQLEKKTFTCEVRAGDKKDRTIDFLGSTETTDRMGDVIEVSGWDLSHYSKNPVFLWAHSYSDLPVGKALSVEKTSSGLRFKIKFADHPFADTVYKLYQGGFLKATSVGFRGLEREPIVEKDGDGMDRQTGWRYKSQELYELSAVPVPANPDALMLAVQRGIISQGEVKQLTGGQDLYGKILDPAFEPYSEKKGEVPMEHTETRIEAPAMTRKAEMQQVPSRKWASLVGLEDEKEKFSFARAFNGILHQDMSRCPFEAEIFRQTRAMSTGDDSQGGYLVPAQAVPDFIASLAAASVVRGMGATVIQATGSPVLIPTQTASSQVYYPGENAAITPSDITVGQVTLTPKKAAILTLATGELIRRSWPAAEPIIRNDMARSYGLSQDIEILRGTGGGNRPLGINGTLNVQTYGDGSALPDFKALQDMVAKLEASNSIGARPGFIFHPEVKRILGNIRVAQYTGDTEGAFLVPPSDAFMSRIMGYPFSLTTQLPITLGAGHGTEVFFADFSQVIICEWPGLEILASNQAGDAFSKDLVYLRLIAEYDVGLRHPEAACVGSFKVA